MLHALANDSIQSLSAAATKYSVASRSLQVRWGCWQQLGCSATPAGAKLIDPVVAAPAPAVGTAAVEAAEGSPSSDMPSSAAYMRC